MPGPRVGYLSTFYHTSVLIMATGCFDAEWRLFGNGPAIVDAFGRNELDLAYIGLPPAIIGIDRGILIRCVAGGHIEGTVISGRRPFQGFPEVRSLGDLLRQFVDLKVGVPGKGSIHDVIIRKSLERYGLLDKIGVVNFKWADLVTEAVIKGEVAAAVGTPALAVAVERYAGGEILYPPALLWPGNPSYGIVASCSFLRDQAAALERFLMLHEETTSLIRNDPEGVSRKIAGFVGVIDEGFVLDTIKISPKYCAQLTDTYMSSTMDFVRSMRKMGYINRIIPSGEIFDTSLIRRVHPEGDHYGDGLPGLGRLEIT